MTKDAQPNGRRGAPRAGASTSDGRAPGARPTVSVWVLADDRPGNTTQSVGLAEALGFGFEIKRLRFTPLIRVHNRLLRTYGASRIGLRKDASDPLVPPWPDLVISSGWRPAPIACWIGKQSRGRSVVVQLGRKGGHVPNSFDLVITCGYAHLPPDPRRIETTAPLTRVDRKALASAAEAWKPLFAQRPRPWIGLLVGGATRRHRWDEAVARQLAERVRAMAEAAGGSVFAVTSRRTGQPATEAIERGLGPEAHVSRWDPHATANPYLGFLALADVLVVTGESESMLAEAAACGKPVQIYPLPEHPPGPAARIKDWMTRRARQSWTSPESAPPVRRLIGRGATALIRSGVLRPRRDLPALHAALLEAGIASPFGAPLQPGPRPPLREADEVARKVAQLLRSRGQLDDR
ncbi:MAG: hypothetical protein Kow0092_17110 [Deferrisomatales bacterium]